jgi:hypothetical protein
MPKDALNEGGWSPKDELLALCIARGQTREAAMKEVGYARRTVYNKVNNLHSKR